MGPDGVGSGIECHLAGMSSMHLDSEPDQFSRP
jgi:hypothetical protein